MDWGTLLQTFIMGSDFMQGQSKFKILTQAAEAEEKYREWEQGFKEKELGLKERELQFETLEQKKGLTSDLTTMMEEYRKKFNTPEEALKDFESEKDLWIDIYSPVLGEDTEEKLKTKIRQVMEGKKAGRNIGQILGDIFKPTTALPTTAPAEAKFGEWIGGLGRRGLEAVSKVPSQAMGLGATGYNVLAGGVSGMTGVPQQTIPQPYLDLMRRGELFNVPRAYDYWRGRPR